MSSDHSYYFSTTSGNQLQQQHQPTQYGLGTNAVTQALSSLQAKVAHLEQERDHYALECERITALHKEEMMKMEKTIRTEREEAARRQDDLRESISRAAEERARLVAIIDEKKIEHSQAMHKLERIREAEAADNNNNTAKQSPYGGVDDLTLRVSQCKRQQDNTQSQIQNLLNQIEVARREREVCEATNDRVMAVLRELGDHVPPPLPPPTYTTTKRSTSTATTTATRSNNGRRSASPRGIVPVRTPVRGSGGGNSALLTSPSFPTGGSGVTPPGGALLETIMEQLHEENSELLQQYRRLVAQGAQLGMTGSTGSASEITLNSQLQSLLKSMERKADQIRQIQQWKLLN